MKKILSAIYLLSCAFNLSAQSLSFSFNYLGEDFMLYKGCFIKVQEDAISGFGATFFGDLESVDKVYLEGALYPTSEYKSITEKDSLVNRVFKVVDIVDKKGQAWDETLKYDFFEKPFLVLTDTTTNQTIYFKYDTQFEHNFPFNSSKIDYPKDVVCAQLDREVDDFTNEITIHSPLTIGQHLSPMSIHKEIKRGQTRYYLGLNASGTKPRVGGTNVIVLFEDGTKWIKQSRISVDVADAGFSYFAYIGLTLVDLKTFSTKRIKKIRLQQFDNAVGESFGDKFKVFVSCVKDAK